MSEIKQRDLFAPSMSARLSAPYSSDSDTSEAAAASIRPHLNKLQAEVLDAIESYIDGLTCDEVEMYIDRKHQTVSARILELRRKGLIRDSGYRRKTRSGRKAVVWRVVK